MISPVQAVAIMLSNQNKIKNIIKANEVFIFSYLEKQVWGVYEYEDENENPNFAVRFYPRISKPNDVTTGAEDITFRSSEIRTEEAKTVFGELFSVVKSKYFKLDEIFDEIVKNDASNEEIPF